jgi:hypothetical protein
VNGEIWKVTWSWRRGSIEVSTVRSGEDWRPVFVCSPLRTHRRLLEVFLKSNSLAPSESNSQRNCAEPETAKVLVKCLRNCMCLSNAPKLEKDCYVSGVVAYI